jgi:hypothetical protein
MGNNPVLLDKDGVQSDISGEPGVWSHAYEEFYWPCPRRQNMTITNSAANVERTRSER